ncbi:MAG: crossover junction endodeoxyribonuclease RuvC [Candidatus Aquicultorales bacterium]
MIIVGLDPAIDDMGWAILDAEKGDTGLIAFGTIRTIRSDPVEQRLLVIGKETRAVLEDAKRHADEAEVEVAIEHFEFHTRGRGGYKIGGEKVQERVALRSAEKVNQAIGVILYEVKRAGLSPVIYSLTEYKEAMAGDKYAKKEDIARVVRMRTGRSDFKNDNETDAAAIALYHRDLMVLERSVRR